MFLIKNFQLNSTKIGFIDFQKTIPPFSKKKGFEYDLSFSFLKSAPKGFTKGFFCATKNDEIVRSFWLALLKTKMNANGSYGPISQTAQRISIYV